MEGRALRGIAPFNRATGSDRQKMRDLPEIAAFEAR